MRTSGLHELLSLGRDTELLLTGTQTVHTDGNSPASGAMKWKPITGLRSAAPARCPVKTCRLIARRSMCPPVTPRIEHVLERSGPSVFRTIEERFGITVERVSQTTQAIRCPADISGIIGLDVDAPALRIVAQLYDTNATLMEISVATFDPEKFQLQTDVEID